MISGPRKNNMKKCEREKEREGGKTLRMTFENNEVNDVSRGTLLFFVHNKFNYYYPLSSHTLKLRWGTNNCYGII